MADKRTPPGKDETGTKDTRQIRLPESESEPSPLAIELEPQQNGERQQQQESQTLSQNITKAFKLLRYFLLFTVSFPFIFKEDPTGSFGYRFKRKCGRTIGFLIITIFLSIILMLNMINYFGLLLNYPPQKPFLYKNFTRNLHDEEVYLLHRNNSHVIAIFSHLTHVVLSNWVLLLKRDLTVKYLTFWSSAVEIFSIDAANGVKKYMKIVTWVYIGSCILIAVLNCPQFIPALNGAAAIFTILTLRTFSPALHVGSGFGALRSIFAIILLYIRICSSIYILFYLFQCKLLVNAFVEWNLRLKMGLFKRQPISRYSVFKTLAKPEIGMQVEPDKNFRTSLDILYKDYHCIMRIMEATDQVFSTILLTYYGSQIMATCFQIFHLYNALLNKDEFSPVRRLDAIVMIIFIAQSVTLLFLVSKYAARVGSEAIDGMEVLRVKGYLGRKTEEEAYFMLSMSESYGGYFETTLTGGRFFSLSKPFLITIGGVIFTYVILIIQFTYIFKANFEDDMAALKKPSNSTLILHDLLQHVEGIINIFNLNMTGYV